MIVTLPWPPAKLRANNRTAHRYSGAERKGYKQACWALAKEAKFRSQHLDITFHPPCGRKRDLDNMLSSIKYGLDGLSLAMGVDDSTFTITMRKGPPARPDGAVVIRGGVDHFDQIQDHETALPLTERTNGRIRSRGAE